jgi:DNA-directed RNA polymerase subunit RPC12/RpoP
MAKLLYRCPRTGVNVEISFDDEVTPASADTYEHVTCPSCSHVHFINRGTGKVLGDKAK